MTGSFLTKKKPFFLDKVKAIFKFLTIKVTSTDFSLFWLVPMQCMQLAEFSQRLSSKHEISILPMIFPAWLMCMLPLLD